MLHQISQAEILGNCKSFRDLNNSLIVTDSCLQYASYACITFGCVVMGISVLLSVNKIMKGKLSRIHLTELITNLMLGEGGAATCS